MKKYIAYCRKSRDEVDKQVLSIQAQIAELEEFAKRERIQIVEFVTEAKTAKMPGREQFANVLQKIESGQANGIIAWHPDRLARNSMDGGKIIYLLDTGHLIDLKFPTFWFENTPQGKFMLSIAFGQSKYYIDNLSENVKRGMRQKLRNGVWPLRAPMGYVNNPKTRDIDVDPVKSKAIEKAFSLFAEGNKSFTDISRFLLEFGLTRKNGKPLHINQIKDTLTDKFYIGIMTFNGEYYDGTHQPIIDKELFQRVQHQVKQITKPQTRGKYFPFIGLARCGECGAAITAETHKKHYPRTNRTVIYNYYRCTKKIQPCTQKPITEVMFEEQLRNQLLDVELPNEVAEMWMKRLDECEVTERANVQLNESKLKKEIANTESKLNGLLDSYLEQVVDAETYKNKKNELYEKKKTLEEKINKIQLKGSTWIEPFREFIQTALQCGKIARAKNNGEDVRIFTKRVGSNFFLRDRQVNVEYKRPFSSLRMKAGIRSSAQSAIDMSLYVGAARLELATSRSQTARSTI